MQTIQAILATPAMLVLARLAVTSFFWISAGIGLLNFGRMVKSVAGMGLPVPVASASATIACQVVGSVWIVLDIGGTGWAGAAILIMFTIMTIPLGHPFWKFDGEKRTEALQVSLEHLTVIGGLILAAMLSGKP
ncbi:DoxX family protein [Burkholderia stagnalis]